MFIGRKLRRKRDAIIEHFEKLLADARQKGDSELVNQTLADYRWGVRAVEIGIDVHESDRVVDAADRLDVELPGEKEPDCWVMPPSPTRGKILTSKGRAIVRKRIYEGELRRFELKPAGFRFSSQSLPP